MIFLTAVQTLQAVRAEVATTSELVFTCTFVDENMTTCALGAVGAFDGVTTGITAITLMPSPSAGTIRRVSGFSLFNADTVASIATVQLLDNATTRTIWKGLLIDGDTLFYSDLRGFYIINSAGEKRVAIANLGSTSSSSSSSVPAHATSHESGGTDPIPLDTLAAPSDVVTLNASTAKHGLLPKLSGTADDNLKGDGTWSSTVKAANLTGTITSATQDLITRLGTIVSGVWNGTRIALAYGGTNVDLSASGSSTNILAQDGSHVISARDLVAADIPNLAASKITSGTLALARGGTNADLSATGGSNQILKQASAGAAITVGTMASTGLSDTANLAYLNGNPHFTGNVTVDGGLQFGNTATFSWNAKSLNTVYQALSDGFVLGYFLCTGGGDLIKVTTDASNPPTTDRVVVQPNTVAYAMFICPVRKSDYYKIADGGSGATLSAGYWVPLGTAG